MTKLENKQNEILGNALDEIFKYLATFSPLTSSRSFPSAILVDLFQTDKEGEFVYGSSSLGRFFRTIFVGAGNALLF